MSLEERILNADTKQLAVEVAEIISDNPESFALLMQLFLTSDYRQCQRASWVLGNVIDLNPKLVIPYIPSLIEKLSDPKAEDAVKRNIVRSFQFIDIPEEYWGETVDVCFRLMRSAQEAIAIKVFAMTVIFNICQQVPEIADELIMAIEDQLPFGSAGFKNRAGKILKALDSGSNRLK